jgi:hypothetical protein
MLWSASGFVIDPAADQAHPGGRVGGGGHGERAPLIRWVRLYRCGFAFLAGTIQTDGHLLFCCRFQPCWRRIRQPRLRHELQCQ